jgi:hypothetical protein
MKPEDGRQAPNDHKDELIARLRREVVRLNNELKAARSRGRK